MTEDHDWTVIEIPGVLDVVEQAAAKVAEHFEYSVDDLVQEASIRVCDLRTNLPECVLREEPELGKLQHRLEQDLVDIVRTEVSRRNRNSSYEDRYDEAFEAEDGESGGRGGLVAIRTEVSSYTKELVESLLPAIWDESYCYGVRAENAPDPDMPRGSMNKATGNTAGAHFADIHRAWALAELSVRERQALFLTYAQDRTQSDSARLLGVSQQNVSDWTNSGVGRLVAFLNGKEA